MDNYTQDPQTVPRHDLSPSSSIETPTFLEERARYDRIPALKKIVATTAAMIRNGRTVKLATRYIMAMKNDKKTPEENKISC